MKPIVEFVTSFIPFFPCIHPFSSSTVLSIAVYSSERKTVLCFLRELSDVLCRKLNQNELASCMKNAQNLLLSLEMKGSFWYLVHCNWNGKTLEVLVMSYVMDSKRKVTSLQAWFWPRGG